MNVLLVFIQWHTEIFEGTWVPQGHMETKSGQKKGIRLGLGSSLPEPIPIPSKGTFNNDDDRQGKGGHRKVQPQNA